MVPTIPTHLAAPDASPHVYPAYRDHVQVPTSTFTPCRMLKQQLDTINCLERSRNFGCDIYLQVVDLVGQHLSTGCNILVGEIARNNNLFCGNESSRVPTHNMSELMKRTYYFVGMMLALSLLHGGPAPIFFFSCCIQVHCLWFSRNQGKSRRCPVPTDEE